MHSHGEAVEEAVEEATRRVILVGNSNVGKSVWFRLLTGRYVVVSNYPGTTVEIARGLGKVAGSTVEVIDTPGANSLSPNSEDERVARDVVLKPGEKVVVQIADAKNLRRALLLTAQLAELEVPTVLALNMWDEAQDRGIEIDLDSVREAVGAPVVPTVATERRGFHRLVYAIGDAEQACFRPEYGSEIEVAVKDVEALLPEDATGRRGLALMLLADDSALEEMLSDRASPSFRESVAAVRERLASRLAEPIRLVLQRRRVACADAVVERAVTRKRGGGPARGFWRRAFFFVLAPALFYAVGWRLASLIVSSGGEPRFSGLGTLGTLLISHGVGLVSLLLYGVSAWRREYAKGGSAASALARLSTHPVGGFPLLIFVLWVIYRVVGGFGAVDCVDFLEGTVFGTFEEGQYGGFINGPLSRGLGSLIGTENIVYDFFFAEQSGLISTGLTYAVAIVFPIVTLFFFAFALMEDSGYLPRLALLLDRAFKRMGLSGKAVLPMVLGLGCGTMATLTTRILETRRQRLIAILLLALAVPCSAQLGIITAVLAGISAMGTLIYVGVIFLVLLAVGWGASKIMPGEPADLLIEVPPFRWPSLRNVATKTYHRVKWFMREAVPLFLLGTVLLFIAEKTGLLALIEAGARPVVTGVLGLPAKTAIGFILGFLRRDFGAVIIFEQFNRGEVAADQALIALIVITLFVPCLAHFFVCVRELGWRKALLLDLVVFTIAVLVGGLVRLLISVTGVQITATG